VSGGIYAGTLAKKLFLGERLAYVVARVRVAFFEIASARAVHVGRRAAILGFTNLATATDATR
jgi:hypothetical protein